MDEEVQEEPQGFNPVVRVPVHPAELLDERRRPHVIEAPLDAATHWDERIWGQS
ncbi:hypothetical protein ABT052_17815 [Streptomyces sp. NPDC002766]|uniref:hypothetical protein n=1 Tax=Streptomyces sp. NPDC002766 TaxID=3154429 RepID=UPI00332F333A